MKRQIPFSFLLAIPELERRHFEENINRTRRKLIECKASDYFGFPTFHKRRYYVITNNSHNIVFDTMSIVGKTSLIFLFSYVKRIYRSSYQRFVQGNEAFQQSYVQLRNLDIHR